MLDWFRSRQFRSSSSGFSLIEMLAAIFVLFVLAAIIIASLMRASDRASMAKSSSNLRQCTTGLMLLAGDRGGVLSVRGGGAGSGSDETSFWPHQLEIFLDIDRSVFFSSKAEHGLEDGIYQEGLLWPYRVSYGLNFTLDSWTSSRNENEYRVQTLYLSRLDEPSKTILLASSMDGRGFGRYAINDTGRNPLGSLHLRYSGKVLVGFADGSVRSLSKDDEWERYGFTGAYGETVNDWISF